MSHKNNNNNNSKNGRIANWITFLFHFSSMLLFKTLLKNKINNIRFLLFLLWFWKTLNFEIILMIKFLFKIKLILLFSF
jgi:hypothetical protein